MRKRMIILAMALLLGRALAQQGDKPGEKQNPLPTSWIIPPAPIRSPADELKTLHLADDFLTVELFASEPMIQDPVALDFDAAGRAWAVEMRDYMPDIDAHGENEPIGRVSILTDSDGDGRADKSTVFLDHLIMPRAIKVCWGGALIATDDQLWFAKDTNGDDVADTKEVVDPDYIRSGNPEHQPNGLLLAMDNWIYSTYSDQRYRRVDGVWIREKTEYRGQWGIGEDDLGRVYYNVNFSQLHGDAFPPNYSFRNPDFTPVHGINQQIATNQTIYTLRPNTGVNRAYRPGVLDDRGHLKEFTSACSPMVERGGILFGTDATLDSNSLIEGELNVFVCEPAANLVKRNLVRQDGLLRASRFAYPDRDFLVSTDERFRPVNIYNAPDGSVFVVDMYRGICQHHEYMTTHLRHEVLSRGLDKGIHLGRIWRVRNKTTPLRTVADLERWNTSELLNALRNRSGWVRDTAQRLIVERGDKSVIPKLFGLALTRSTVESLHALGCVDGLLAEAKTREGLTSSIAYSDQPNVWNNVFGLIICDRPWVDIHTLRLAERLAAGDSTKVTALISALAQQIDNSSAKPNLHWDLQAALTLGEFDTPASVPPLARLLIRHADDPVMRDAIFCARPGRELPILKSLLASPEYARYAGGRDVALQELSSILVRRGQSADINQLVSLIGQQVGATDWRQLPLLNGFSENALALRRKPLNLDREPTILTTLAGDTNALTQAALVSIRNGVDWPGHKIAKPVTTPLRKLSQAAARHVELGRTVFRNACAACHGVAGTGLPNLGPPLVDSNWLKGPVQRIALIALYGLEGPIEVNGQTYAPPRILPNMPAVGTLSDAEVAAVASFVRREFGQQNGLISPDAVTYLRAAHAQRDAPWAPDELLNFALPDITPKAEREAESHPKP